MFSFSYTYVVCMGACPNHGPKSDFTWASASTLRCIIYGQRPQTELLKCHFSFHLMVAAQSDLCDNTEWSKCHSQNYTGKRSICILYQINLEKSILYPCTVANTSTVSAHLLKYSRENNLKESLVNIFVWKHSFFYCGAIRYFLEHTSTEHHLFQINKHMNMLKLSVQSENITTKPTTPQKS